MKLSEIIIKFVGLILILVGLGLVLAACGVANVITMTGGLGQNWLAVVVGLVLIGAGVVLIRGGNITL